MAFYEMLPGAGMPSGLQAGMDSVLNKKFGTSTTYPAEGWPDNVNLLGPLPEKTVSGTIVTFADGADAVPLKKCEVSLSASLDGYSEVDVAAIGKNMLNPATCQRGFIGANGVINSPYSSSQELYSDYIKVKSNTTYTFSGTVSNSSEKWRGIAYYDKDKNFIIRQAGVSGTDEHFSIGYKTPNNAEYVRCTWRNYSDISSGGSVCPCQFEEGTETDYEPYSGTTHTADLGRTIHGGTVDVVNGQGVNGIRALTISGDVVYYGTYGTDNAPLYYWEIPDATTIPIKPVGSSSSANLLMCSDIFSRISTISSGDMKNKEMRTQDAVIPQRLYFRWDEMSDVNAINTYLESNPITVLVELQVPTDFTFDPVPIDSKLGNNTLWAEQGDVEVAYRADIALALGE